ncbi:MAG: class I SAM-dependent methyltransferase [Bacteroidota bacterium]
MNLDLPSVPPSAERVSCPLCSADEPVLWAQDNGYTAQRCGACRFVYVSPRPSLATIDEASQTGLHQTERGVYDAVSVSGFSRRKVRMFEERLGTLFPDGRLTQRPVRWLDVGCGFGELVAAVEAVSHPGSEVTGIDPCRPKVDVGRRKGLSVSDDQLEDVGEGYDVISLVNVFSHLPDPIAFLGRLRDMLAPSGELVLVTGNGADVEYADYPDPLLLPDHLVFAGEQHLVTAMRRLEMSVLKIERYDHFYRDPLPLFAAKYAAKRVLGRPVASWSSRSAFRSVFMRARVD